MTARLFPAAAMLAILLFRTEAAAGIDCHAARLPAERAICADSTLRAADRSLGEHYAIVRGAVVLSKPLTAALTASQRRWLGDRNRCADATCVASSIAARDRLLSILARGVTEANPTLFDLRAVWLEGTWVAGQEAPPGYELASALPDADSTFTFHDGTLCRGSNCDDVAMQLAVIGDAPGKAASAAGPSAHAPFYLLTRNGGDGYTVASLPNGDLLAVADGCARGGKPCNQVRQIWHAKGPDNALRSVDLAAP